MHELLDIVSLRSFLNVYPGPAFAISSASYGNPTLAYGNPALHSLILGEGNTAILDDASFFSAICDANVFRWLYEPITTVDASKASWNIDLRPLWLSHEHDPLRLKFTVTSIHSQLEFSDDHLILYTAPPTRISTASLPFGKVDEVTERPVPTSGHTAISELDRTIPRHLEAAPTTLDLPSSLLNKFPWEKTSLGPQSEWPESLKTMVQYTMAKALPSTLYWGWPDLVMIYNDAYATLVGPKHPSIYGQKASIVWKDQWTRVSSIAELCKQGQAHWHIDDPLFFTSVTEFGYPREVYHTWHWTPIRQEDGSVGGILNSTYDTTQRVIAERRMRWITDFISQLAKAKTQDEVSRVLLDVVSGHEIDFPFAALYYCDSSDMQARPHLKDTDSRISKFLTSMSPVKATLSLVGAVGIPDNHPAAPQSVEYTLNPTTLQQLDAERKGIELHIETQMGNAGPAPYTYIDIQLWEKIFYNLFAYFLFSVRIYAQNNPLTRLSNAFKYTKVGKVTVSVSYDSTSAYLRVSDTGIGIPLAKQDDVFGLFQRLNDLPAEGSGVGLAVAKELVSLHGGKLSVSSRAESEYVDSTGSTFTVELPLGRDHLAPELVVDDKRIVPLSDPSFNKPNYWANLDVSTPELETNEVGDISASMFFNQTDVVLVVDNDSDMRSFLRSIFAPFMKVLEACDGVDALEVVHSSDVDLILRQALLLFFRSLS
ncbi:hypothetical protein FRC12_012423 [Ceratobasidium sp. 428]|nr:hypothetical protein FRC12_012423 [Ceratobasidium sp. 428]